MKIIVVGATGTIGKVVSSELGKRHEIIKAASKSGDVKVDITSSVSIKISLNMLAILMPSSQQQEVLHLELLTR